MKVTSSHFQPTSSRFRIWFWVVGIVAFFFFLSLVKSILLPFVVGMLSAYFLDPAVRKLDKMGWSRSGAAACITIVFFMLAATACVILIPLIAHQLGLLLNDMPEYVTRLRGKYDTDIQHYLNLLGPDQISTIQDAVGNFSGTLVHWAGSVATSAVQSGLALLNILSLIFITPVVVFYLLRDWDKLIVHFDNLLPREHAKTIREQLHEIDSTLSGFIRGQTNVCLIMASYYGIALSLVGLKFGLVIGIMTGLLLFMPFVGYATGFTLSTMIALFQFDTLTHVIAVLAVYGVGQVLEGSIITPKLVGSKVGLHPLWIIFGMLSGAALFGLVGILISIPITAIIGVLVRFAISRYLKSSLYRGEA